MCAAQFGAGGITPVNLERVLTILEVWAFHVCILSLSSIHGFRVVPHVGYMGTVHPKGMPFNDGRIGKIVGLGIKDVRAKKLLQHRLLS